MDAYYRIKDVGCIIDTTTCDAPRVVDTVARRLPTVRTLGRAARTARTDGSTAIYYGETPVAAYREDVPAAGVRLTLCADAVERVSEGGSGRRLLAELADLGAAFTTLTLSLDLVGSGLTVDSVRDGVAAGGDWGRLTEADVLPAEYPAAAWNLDALGGTAGCSLESSGRGPRLAVLDRKRLMGGWRPYADSVPDWVSLEVRPADADRAARVVASSPSEEAARDAIRAMVLRALGDLGAPGLTGDALPGSDAAR